MKKTLESIINVLCNLFIIIAIGFGFYFLVMLKLAKVNPENLLNYFGGGGEDVALWNIWNILASKFTIIFLVILVLGIALFFRRFFTERKTISKVSLGIIIKSIILIVIIKCSRFLLGALTDYTTHLENNQGATAEYSTTLYNKSVNVENPEIIDDCITVDGEYKCAVDTEEPIVDEPIEDCNRYFDGCNRCTKQDDGERICTEEACEQYQETYCADEQYDKFLEDIKSSNELGLYHNAQYGIQIGLSEELNGGKIIEEDRDDMFPHHLIIFMAKDDTATADETGIDGYREKFTVWVVPVENYEDAMIGFTEDNILGKNNKYYFFESKPDPLDTNYYYINMFVENVK